MVLDAALGANAEAYAAMDVKASAVPTIFMMYTLDLFCENSECFEDCERFAGRNRGETVRLRGEHADAS